MSRLSVRNVSEPARVALRVRAALNGRSVVSELREIIEETLLPTQRMRIGTGLLEIALSLGTASLVPPRDAPQLEPE